MAELAAKCDADDYGLTLGHDCERYVHVPMRDTVEKERVHDCLRLVCQILVASSPCFPILSARYEAALYNAAPYIRFKAGCSRSVAAVMAYYLIHAAMPTTGLFHAHTRSLSVPTAAYPPTSDSSRQLPMLSSQEVEGYADVGLVVAEDMEIMDTEGRWASCGMLL